MGQMLLEIYLYHYLSKVYYYRTLLKKNASNRRSGEDNTI